MINKYKYRFKTKEEFIQEFGNDFRNKICWNNMGRMDYLFGTICKVNIEKLNNVNSYFEYNKMENRINKHIEIEDSNGRNWCIFREMLIELVVEPDYKPRKLIYD